MTNKDSIGRLACVSLLALGLAAGCGQKPATPVDTSAAPQSEPETATSRDFGDYVLHFNAIRTDALTPDIARNYGITRSANRALVNISIVKKAAGTTGAPVPGTVTVQAVNLNGQFKDLTVREVREGEAVYYIGDVPVSNDETLVFTVNATPANESSRFSVRFQRQFVGN